MEVNLVTGIKEPILVSNSSHSPTKSKPDVRGLLAQQEADKCKHFTIRGFVSEVRKRNAKICWPFSIRDYALDGDEHTLSPLPVKNFRRWACEGCVPKLIAPEAVIENGGNISNETSGAKLESKLLLDDPTKAHHEAIKFLDTSQQQSEENSPEEIEVQQDSSVRVGNCEKQPSFHCSEKHDESQAPDLIRGDISVTKGGYNRLKESHSPMSKPNAIAAEQEASQMEEKEEANRVDDSDIARLTEDTLRILPCERDTITLVHRTRRSRTSGEMVAPLVLTSASSKKEQNQGVGKLGKRKEPDSQVDKAYRMPLEVDIAIPEGGVIPSPSVPITPHDSKGLDGSGDAASDTSIHLVDDMLHGHDAVKKPGVFVEKSRARKSRKMRTLYEIINSGGLKNDGKKYISSVETLQAPREKIEHLSHGFHLIQNTEATEIERNNGNEAFPSDSEGTRLIDWLKTVPRKASLHKGEADSKRINNVASASKFATGNLQYSGPGESKQELIGEMKHNMMTELEVVKPSKISQEDRTVQKGHITTEDLPSKHLRGKKAGILASDKEPETHDNISKKVSSNNKNKRTLVEDGASSQQYFKEQSAPQVQSKGKKKRRIMPISEPDAVDDFAMEIIEVLSNMSAKNHNAIMSKSSEMTISLKDDDGRDGNTANDDSSPVRNNKDDGSGASHSSAGSKQCHQFDLNQEASACAAADLLEPSQLVGLSVSEAQLSVVNSNRNYTPRNLFTEGVKMVAFCSDNINRTTADHNVFKTSIDGSFGLPNGYPPPVNPNSMHSGVNRQAVAPNADCQISAKLSKDEAESLFCRGTCAAKSFAEPGNGYYSDLMRPVNVQNNVAVSGDGYHPNMMQPGIIHSNGTDSAVNLLRLMQHSPHSVEPRQSSGYDAYMGCIQSSNGHSWEFLRSQVLDPKMLSGSSSNCKLDKQPRDLCRPLRPCPRNILGPLLQMEVNNSSNDIAAPILGFGFIARESNAPRLASVANILPSTSRHGAFENVGSSIVSHATSGYSPSGEGIGRVVTGSRYSTFQPLRSTSKMLECLLNRNPADFASPDEDSEYMIGYDETNTDNLLQSGTLLPQTHLHGKKGQKMRRLNDLNRCRRG